MDKYDLTDRFIMLAARDAMLNQGCMCKTSAIKGDTSQYVAIYNKGNFEVLNVTERKLAFTIKDVEVSKTDCEKSHRIGESNRIILCITRLLENWFLVGIVGKTHSILDSRYQSPYAWKHYQSEENMIEDSGMCLLQVEINEIKFPGAYDRIFMIRGDECTELSQFKINKSTILLDEILQKDGIGKVGKFLRRAINIDTGKEITKPSKWEKGYNEFKEPELYLSEEQMIIRYMPYCEDSPVGIVTIYDEHGRITARGEGTIVLEDWGIVKYPVFWFSIFKHKIRWSLDMKDEEL